MLSEYHTMREDRVPVFRIRLDIEYDGTEFHGWQIQPSIRTVQGELRRAFIRLFDLDLIPMASGRTDTGVHALNQVAHCDIPAVSDVRDLRRSLNAVLPKDIIITDISLVSRLWDARRDAIARIYRYRIRTQPTALFRSYTWVYGTVPSLAELQYCASLLHGRQDVRNFCRLDRSRKKSETFFHGATWYTSGPELHFVVCATHFYHRLVRRLVGAQILNPDSADSCTLFRSALSGSNHSTPSAPPHGLCFIGPLFDTDATQRELKERWISVMFRKYPLECHGLLPGNSPEP